MALHGRDADLALLDETLAAVTTGRGRALFVTGEAGIGKSTVLAEAKARANAMVLSGAAWESAGAPPYWPWQQVLRDAADQVGARVRKLPGAERIASLVPEWGAVRGGSGGGSGGGGDSGEAPDPAAARFALLDAVVRGLVALAYERPFVLVLDDLHGSDLPSLDLLVMFARELPRAPIALVAAWREGELAVREDAALRLGRVSRCGVVRPLRRLTADEVATWVGADGAAIFASTEGNPLFVEETLRSRSGGSARGVATAIADHLALAGAATRELLATAAVLGRTIEPVLVSQLAQRSVDAVEGALGEAAQRAIVEQTERGWRFCHILLRDHLYRALPPSQRAELHRRAGELLEPIDATRAAHHLLAADDTGRAITAARAAAAHAKDVYAFEDAADLLTGALRAIEGTPFAHEPVAIDLRIDLAEALHHVGKAEQARTACVKAAELARTNGDVERIARAAMVYAAELASGARDAMMIALLDEARAKLPAQDSRMLARVLARLAAALVPGPEPEIHKAQATAREAVAMARRLGDPETTMFALRYAAHAHSYQISIHEALAMSLEVVALSDQLGRPLEGIDHRAWLYGAHLAVGDLANAQTALERFETLLAPLPQPHYRWRAPLVRSAWATRIGDFVEAERRVAAVHELAREYQLDRAAWACMFAKLGVVAASRDPVRAAMFVDEIRDAMRIGPIAGNFVAFVLALAGRHDEARAALERTIFIPALVVLQFSAEAVLLLRSREYAMRLLPLLENQVALHPIVHGPQSSLMARPSALVLGEMYLLLDRVDDAIGMLEQGLALARAIEAPPFIAIGAASLAGALARRGAPVDRERIAQLRAEAARLVAVFHLHGIEIGEERRDAEPIPAHHDIDLTIQCDGDRAVVRWNGRELAATSKGFEFIAALLAAPGREIHVSDLVGDDDRGDAGEVLDAKARSSYRERAVELQRDLDAARAGHDLARAERLAAELEAITDELLGATGLGGRARKAGSRVERARVNVQRRIKDAIKRLAGEDPGLGRYLEATIRTGTFCSFVPLRS